LATFVFRAVSYGIQNRWEPRGSRAFPRPSPIRIQNKNSAEKVSFMILKTSRSFFQSREGPARYFTSGIVVLALAGQRRARHAPYPCQRRLNGRGDSRTQVNAMAHVDSDDFGEVRLPLATASAKRPRATWHAVAIRPAPQEAVTTGLFLHAPHMRFVHRVCVGKKPCSLSLTSASHAQQQKHLRRARLAKFS